MNVECFTCKKEFHKKPSHIKNKNFCSNNCRRNGIVVLCDFCKKSITKKPNQLREHNFCDRICFGKWKSQKLVGENHPRFFLKPKSCEFCKNIFKPTEKRIKFCRRECANKAKEKQISLICDQCKQTFSTAESVFKWSRIRGHVNSFCCKDCQYEYHKKEQHPRWIDDRSMIKNQDRSLRETEELKQWRLKVFERDDWTCQFCSNRSSSGNKIVINAHHIKRLTDHPEIACDINNGICLCENCHKKTYQCEESYELLFTNIIGKKMRSSGNR